MHDLAMQSLQIAHFFIEHHVPLISAPSPPKSGGDNSTVKVAIVTAIGLVIATAITAIASTFKRSPSPTGTVSQTEVFTKQYIRGLESDRRELAKLRVAHSHLREANVERGLDPDVLIREQAAP